MAASGQFLSPLISKMSTIFPLKPVVLLYGTNIINSVLFISRTLSHKSVVLASKFRSWEGTSSPIRHEVKKHNVQAVQNICLEKGDQGSSEILCRKIFNKCMFIGSLSVLQVPFTLAIFSAPLIASFTQGSEFKLLLKEPLNVCATFKLER